MAEASDKKEGGIQGLMDNAANGLTGMSNKIKEKTGFDLGENSGMLLGGGLLALLFGSIFGGVLGPIIGLLLGGVLGGKFIDGPNGAVNQGFDKLQGYNASNALEKKIEKSGAELSKKRDGLKEQDGSIDVAKLQALSEDPAFKAFQDLHDKKRIAYIKGLDKDNNGKVTSAEFDVLEEGTQYDVKDMLARAKFDKAAWDVAVKSADKDGNGKLSVDEIKKDIPVETMVIPMQTPAVEQAPKEVAKR